MRDSTHQSKSFINAMRALQDKCKRLEDEKAQAALQAAARLEQLSNEYAQLGKSNAQLQQ